MQFLFRFPLLLFNYTFYDVLNQIVCLPLYSKLWDVPILVLFWGISMNICVFKYFHISTLFTLCYLCYSYTNVTFIYSYVCKYVCRGVYSTRVLRVLSPPRSKSLGGCCPVFILMEKGISALKQSISCPALKFCYITFHFTYFPSYFFLVFTFFLII